MLEELKNNEKLKEIYEKRCTYCNRRYQFYSLSKYEIKDLIYYFNNLATDYDKYNLDIKFDNYCEYKNIKLPPASYEEKIKILYKNKYLNNTESASLNDRKFFYLCFVLYGEDYEKLSFIKDYYNIKDYELETFINDGKKKVKTSKYKPIFDKLLKCETEEEIIKLFTENNIDSSIFRHSIHEVLVGYYNSDQYDELYENALNKINIYREYQNKKNEEKRLLEKENEHKKYVQETLPTAKEIISLFIRSNKTIGSFCEDNSIDKNIFKKYVNLVNAYDEDLFEEYSEKTREIRKDNYRNLTDELDDIVNNIKNGIKKDGIFIREYDVIDYYMTKEISTDTILKLYKNILETEDRMILDKFLKKNKIIGKGSPFNTKLVLQEITEVDCKKDNNGFPISGTGRIIKEEEKIEVIDFLKNNKIPLTNKTYNVALKRYLKNDLFVYEDKKNKK